MIWIISFIILSSIIAIIKGFFRRVFGFLLLLAILGGGFYFHQQGVTTVGGAFTHLYNLIIPQTVPDAEVVENVDKGQGQDQGQDQNHLPEHFVYKLAGDESSSTNDHAVQYGATLVFGELDKGRATWGHILVSDHQEPGSNGIERPQSTPKPNIWSQRKVEGKYIYDSSHLIGWQFSGSNDRKNLVQGTSYLNRGVEGSGSDESNIESMLYYEQQLDSWVALHPNYKLDYYVKAIYEGSDNLPSKIYMQWVGVDSDGNTLPIQIGGNSYNIYDNYYAVVLENKTPSYRINLMTGDVSK